MPVAFGDTLGVGQNLSGSGPTITMSTSNAVASGGRLILVASHYGSSSTATASGGGLSWNTDFVWISDTGDTNYRISLMSAAAPSGLASSTTLTVTFSPDNPVRGLCGLYATGISTSSYTDGTSGSGYSSGGAGAWTTGNINTTFADDFLVGASWANFGSTASNTPAVNWNEVSDNQLTNPDISITIMYRIVSATGTYNAGGTWATDPSRVNIIGAYKGISAPDTGLAWIRA